MDNRDCCPTTAGGDSTITNGDEAEVLPRTTQGIATRDEGSQEAEFH